ncbi:MAG: deoxyhypusine synthase family protein [Nitrososphaerota archaeon]|nr:deoxyhypusine synthase family protein [Candidatus Calditenuaceae archaeon]MDW8072973.1 deoxyhypusine synthase family protein [Nitrososphaerota archaeon]
MSSREELARRYLVRELKPIKIGEKKISQLLDDMRATGFQGRRLGEFVRVWEAACEREDTVIFLGLAGSLSTTGQSEIVKWLLRNRFVDVLVSTGANITEDLIEAMGARYYVGEPNFNDEELFRAGIYRFYDVLVRDRDYFRMEEMLADFMAGLGRDKVYSSAAFLNQLGSWLNERGVEGILTEAWRAQVPVFSPALVDSGMGVAYLYNRYRFGERFRLLIDHFRDYELMIRIKARFSNSAAIFIGGGVPKDFIQLAAVAVDTLLSGDFYSTRPHKFAAQITVDAPHWGGLSGATLEEAKSWGKEGAESMTVQCFCDATIALPIVAHALYERVGTRKNHPDLSWVFKEV